MIAPVTGEIIFRDGLHIVAHCRVQPLLDTIGKSNSRRLPVPGWDQHNLGFHDSEFGKFEVEVASGPEGRIHIVFLAHSHAFYQPATPDDNERRTFHEGVINKDLRGQREFAWGEALCRLDREANLDWLLVAYTQGPHVPMRVKSVLKQISVKAETPD